MFLELFEHVVPDDGSVGRHFIKAQSLEDLGPCLGALALPGHGVDELTPMCKDTEVFVLVQVSSKGPLIPQVLDLKRNISVQNRAVFNLKVLPAVVALPLLKLSVASILSPLPQCLN